MKSTTTATDPVERLPYDAWRRCLYFASSDSENGPLPLLFISQRWFQMILEEPTLWATIVLSGRSEDELARIHTFLQLSQEHLLDIVLNSPESDYVPDSIGMILLQAQRIRSITTAYSTYGPYAIKGLAVTRCFTTSVSSFPQLRWINADNGPPDWSKIIELWPCLRIFRSVRVPSSTILPSTLQDITTIALTSLDEALTLIQKEGLRYLGIDYSRLDEEEAWTEHAYKLAHVNLSRITHLKVCLKILSLQMLSTIISALPQLWSLDVTISDSLPRMWPWTPTPLFPDSPTHIGDFSMIWILPHGERRELESNFTRMFSITKALSQVLSFTLEIQLKVPMIAVHNLMSSIPRVRTLRLSLNREMDRQALPPIILSDVVHLDLSTGLILEYLVAPHALSVSLGGDFDKYVSTRLSTLQFQKSSLLINELVIGPEYFDEVNSRVSPGAIKTQWAALHRIRLWGRGWCRTLMYVDSLREVHFESRETPECDGFLLDLLRNPKICPNLRLIKSRNYPRWELLFEVMRSRNRINLPLIQLTICGYPAPAILRRLVLLLQGQADVYTGRDIDEVIYKRFKGKMLSFDACRYCAPLGYTGCNIEIAPKRISEDYISLEAMDLLHLCGDSIAPPAQPRDTKRWKLVTRIEEWYETYPYFHPTLFKASCRRARTSSFVDITGSTLDGVYGPGMMGHDEWTSI